MNAAPLRYAAAVLCLLCAATVAPVETGAVEGVCVGTYCRLCGRVVRSCPHMGGGGGGRGSGLDGMIWGVIGQTMQNMMNQSGQDAGQQKALEEERERLEAERLRMEEERRRMEAFRREQERLQRIGRAAQLRENWDGQDEAMGRELTGVFELPAGSTPFFGIPGNPSSWDVAAVLREFAEPTPGGAPGGAPEPPAATAPPEPEAVDLPTNLVELALADIEHLLRERLERDPELAAGLVSTQGFVSVDSLGDFLFHGVPPLHGTGRLITRHLDPTGLVARAEAWAREMRGPLPFAKPPAPDERARPGPAPGAPPPAAAAAPAPAADPAGLAAADRRLMALQWELSIDWRYRTDPQVQQHIRDLWRNYLGADEAASERARLEIDRTVADQLRASGWSPNDVAAFEAKAGTVRTGEGEVPDAWRKASETARLLDKPSAGWAVAEALGEEDPEPAFYDQYRKSIAATGGFAAPAVYMGGGKQTGFDCVRYAIADGAQVPLAAVERASDELLPGLGAVPAEERARPALAVTAPREGGRGGLSPPEELLLAHRFGDVVAVPADATAQAIEVEHRPVVASVDTGRGQHAVVVTGVRTAKDGKVYYAVMDSNLAGYPNFTGYMEKDAFEYYRRGGGYLIRPRAAAERAAKLAVGPL